MPNSKHCLAVFRFNDKYKIYVGFEYKCFSAADVGTRSALLPAHYLSYEWESKATFMTA